MKEKKSMQIENFLNFTRNALAEYKYSQDMAKEQEQLTQDILHRLELDEMSYHERARLSASLSDVRKERRRYKDAVEELEPVIKFAEQNRKSLTDLEQILGAVRKAEKYHENRSYHPRVLK